MFHTVSLNEVDSGNAVTLLCLPSFQSEVWPAAFVVLWTGADWAAGAAEAVRLSRVGFLRLLLRSRGVHVPDSGFVVSLYAEEPHRGLGNECLVVTTQALFACSGSLTECLAYCAKL